jgi:peptidoglycan-associated lipoprotein
MVNNTFRGGWLIGVLLLSLALIGCPKQSPQQMRYGSTPSTGSGTSGMGEAEIGEGERIQERVQEDGEGGPLQDVFFSYDSFELSEEARQTLQANADWLQNNAEAKVEIEGHCDERGTAEYNLALGTKRARAAQDYLITLGVPAERLSVISYGEELPQCTDANESCWQRNRRGHFSVLR